MPPPFKPGSKFRPTLGFGTAPRVYSIDPSKGRITGGTSITITGDQFQSNATVTFGGVPATGVVVVGPTSITCVTPAVAAAAVVDVVVTCGSQSATLAGGFTYYAATILALEPAYGPLAGGTNVILLGANFDTAATYVVKFGASLATAVAVIDSEHIQATTPNHAIGYVDVVLLVGAAEHARLRNGFQFTLLTRANDIRRQPGISIHDILNNAPNSCSFTVDGQSNVPVVGEKIEIRDTHDGNRLLFAGNVQSVEQVYEDRTDQIAWRVNAADFTWMLNKYRPFASYKNMSASLIVKDLVARFAPRGFTSTHVQTKLARVSILFDGSEDFSTCLNQLAEAIGGGHWYCDYAQDLHFFHRLPTSLIIPQTSGPITAMTVAEGAAIPSTFSFNVGFYLLRSTNVFDNGVESALGPFSNCAALQGTNQVVITNLPVGAAVGTHAVVSRRIYFTYIGPNGIVSTSRFCEVNDNTTVGFTTYFGSTGAPAAVIDLPTSVPLPPANATIPPPAPASSMTAAAGSAAIYIPQAPQLLTGQAATTFSAGLWSFKVSNIYRDGSESLPSTATPSVTLSGAASALLTQIPLGPTVGGIDVVARKVYASFGPTSQRTLAQVIALLQASKDRGTIDADWGNIIGHMDSQYLQTVPIPTTYFDLAMIIGFGDLDAMLNVYGEPDWSPERTNMWYLLNDNTTTTADVGPGTGSGDPLVDSANLQNIPVWPNADGPNLEDTDPPADITDTNPDLLRDGAGAPFTVTSDQSQIRNRVFVIGGGSTLSQTAIRGERVLHMTDMSIYSAVGGTVIVAGQRYGYSGYSSSTGRGTLNLTSPVVEDHDEGEPCRLFYQADDQASQRERAKVELDVNGLKTDGIHEHTIVDSSLQTTFQLYMRAYAELELFAWPIQTVHYSTRDPKTKSGQMVSVDLTNPPCVGDFLIQDVTIDQVHDESDDLLPRYTASASSVKFDLNDLLLSLMGGSSTDARLKGVATSSVDITKTIISAAAGTILYAHRYLTSQQFKALSVTPLEIVPAPGPGKAIMPLWGLIWFFQSIGYGTSAAVNVRHALVEAGVGDGQATGGTNVMAFGVGSGGQNAAQDRYYGAQNAFASPVRSTAPIENRSLMFFGSTLVSGDASNVNHGSIRMAYLVIDDPHYEPLG